MTQTKAGSEKESREKPPIGQRNREMDHCLQEVDFESLSAEEILFWAGAKFPGRAVISTSFQYTGVALIHMATSMGIGLRVATVDTLRLQPETYSFIKQIEDRYQCGVEVYQPEPEQVESMIARFGEYLFFDSMEKQKHCCKVRKTRPHDRLVKTMDCWISGMRRDQSDHRRDHAPKATVVPEYGTRRKIFKLNPMADWSEERLLQYIETHRIPTHPLYDRGYQSIGCIICSTPTLPGEDKRAGRWRWFNLKDRPVWDHKKECGLHYNI